MSSAISQLQGIQTTCLQQRAHNPAYTN